MTHKSKPIEFDGIRVRAEFIQQAVGQMPLGHTNLPSSEQIQGLWPSWKGKIHE